MAKPRGIRNNNPLNIKSGQPWKGLMSKPDGAFAVFQDPEHGIRAAAKLLQTYAEKYDINTVDEIVARWAPTSDGNPVGEYAASVAIWADVEREEQLNMFDFETVFRVLRSMARFENGRPPDGLYWYQEDVWESGLRMAGLVPGKPLKSSRTVKRAATSIGALVAALITDVLSLPPEIASAIESALFGLDKNLLILIFIGVAIAANAGVISSRKDDKDKGRL